VLADALGIAGAGLVAIERLTVHEHVDVLSARVCAVHRAAQHTGAGPAGP
jgi:hypothetical protein